MKLSRGILILTSVVILPCLMEAADARNVPPLSKPNTVERGSNHQMVRHLASRTNAAGVVNLRTNSYTELATGLNYQDNGEWKAAKNEIVLRPDGAGAVAQRGSYQVSFAPNLNTEGVIDLMMADGKRLRSHVLGLGYYDTASGNSVLIAEVQDSVGAVTGGNMVIYTNAFAGVAADVRYTYRKSGFEQDVILREQPPGPDKFGLDPKTTRLEVFTEFLSPPQPARQAVAVGKSALTDEQLDFGAMKIIRGKAFPLGNNIRQRPVPTAKSWVTAGGRTFLIEEVEYPLVKNELKNLPRQAVVTPAKNSPIPRLAFERSAVKSKTGQEQLLADLPRRAAALNQPKMWLAGAPVEKPGYVLDYVTITSYETDFTFEANTTYFISDYVYLTGTTTIEGGAVLKFGPSGSLSVNGNLVCATSTGYHALLTSMNEDENAGESISGANNAPAASDVGLMLEVTSENPILLSGLTFHYTGVGVAASSPSVEVRHCEFAHIGYGAAYADHLRLRNVWVYGGLNGGCEDAAFYPYYSLDAQQVSVHKASHIWSENLETAHLTNCVFTASGNLGLATDLGTAAVSVDTNPGVSPYYVVEPLLASYPLYWGLWGAHLANDSGERNTGVANIEPTLLAEIRTMTTFYPGQAPTNAPVDTMALDRGYHYYVAGGAALNSDGDGLLDAWEIANFGGLSQDDESDYDGDGISDAAEYAAGSDPNDLMVVIRSENECVNSNSVPVLIESLQGLPNQMAVLVNSTNFEAATWVAYTSNAVVSLGNHDGRYDVWIAVRNKTQTNGFSWERKSFFRDTIPPVLRIVNPVSLTSQPVIQIEGESPELIQSLLSYDVFNAVREMTNQIAYVKSQFFDTNQMSITTNLWQCYDVRLANGTNTIIVRAVDAAGNMGVVTNIVIFSVTSDTNAPVFALKWPLNGDSICGEDFTLRGTMDDTTAQLVASVTHSNGSVIQVEGVVERNGLSWVEGLPLASGSNVVVITVIDAAGNQASTNIVVLKSDLEILIDELPENELPFGVLSVVSGTISSTNYTVWVNGVRAAMHGNTWSAENVPIDSGGTALVQARAVPNSDNGGNGAGGGGSGGAGSAGSNPSSTGATTREADKEVKAFIRISSYEKTQKIVMKPPDDGPDITEISQMWTRDKASNPTIKNTSLTPTYSRWGENYYYPADEAVVDGAGGPSKLGSKTTWYEPTGNPVTTPNIRPWPMPLVSYQMEIKDEIRGAVTTVNPPRWDASIQVKVKLELVTGGKAKSGQKNLFRISAGGMTTEDDRPAGYARKPQKPIPATSIKVFDKALLDDGLLFLPFVDNAPIPFTVETPFKNYTFVVSQQKFRLKSWTHACKPNDHERRVVGVGEEVDLSFVRPGDNPEQPVLSVDWSTSSGGLSLAVGALTKFTAPSNAENATVTASFRGASVPVEFIVLEPKGIDHVDKIGTRSYAIGVAGAGMHLRPYLKPINVSFYKVKIMEIGHAAEVHGYFEDHYPGDHDNAAGANDPIPIGCDNSWPATYDHAESASFPGPGWTSGSYTWPIPAKWWIDPNSKHDIHFSDQTFTIDASGTMTGTKFGYTVTRSVNQAQGVITP